MVKLDKIYTRGGDKGETSLGDGSRVPKNGQRVAAYGDVDELNATLGLVRLHVTGDLETVIAHIQNDLFDMGADLCTPDAGERTNGALRVVEGQVEWLEKTIDRLNEALAPLSSFILPGGSAAASYLHLSRTVCRRAERLCVGLSTEEDINQICVRYLNRLSDLLFVMGRYVNDKGQSDILWVPGANRD